MPTALLQTPEYQAAVHNLWEIGQLRYKLEPKQREAYDKIKEANPEDIFFLLCHRGFGKTFLGSVLGNETARREHEGSILIVSVQVCSGVDRFPKGYGRLLDIRVSVGVPLAFSSRISRKVVSAIFKAASGEIV